MSLLIALALTWLPAWVWLERLVPPILSGRRYIIAGYALLLGIIGITVIMRMQSAVGIPFSFFNTGVAACVILLAGLLAPTTWRSREIPGSGPGQAFGASSRMAKTIIAICLALIVLRLVTLGFEVALRPLFSWDGKQHWAKQAKVFFEMGSIVPYVPLQSWLDLAGSDVYTNMHPNYPITIPLIQVWVNLALGEWHDSFMNLPWLLCYIAMGLIFFGQARAAGINTATALACTYMLMSIPYLNIQVALAGYADLFMAACYLAAVAAFYNWSVTRQKWQAVLALLCVSSCLLIKNEGFYWSLSFLPGLVFVLLGPRKGAIVTGCLFLCLLLLLWVLPANLIIAGHSLEQTQLHYRPQGWSPLYLSFFAHDNWHLVGYLFIGLLLALSLTRYRTAPQLAGVATTILSTIGLYLALYLLTRHSHGAVYFTSLNRVALQIVPAVCFLAVLVYGKLSRDPV